MVHEQRMESVPPISKLVETDSKQVTYHSSKNEMIHLQHKLKLLQTKSHADETSRWREKFKWPNPHHPG
jgi:hypothetical protein